MANTRVPQVSVFELTQNQSSSTRPCIRGCRLKNKQKRWLEKGYKRHKNEIRTESPSSGNFQSCNCLGLSDLWIAIIKGLQSNRLGWWQRDGNAGRQLPQDVTTVSMGVDFTHRLPHRVNLKQHPAGSRAESMIE